MDDEQQRNARLRVRAVFQAMDADGNGVLDLSEFRNLFKRLNSGKLLPDAVDCIFDTIDEDGNGFVTVDELLEFLFATRSSLEQKYLDASCEILKLCVPETCRRGDKQPSDETSNLAKDDAVLDQVVKELEVIDAPAELSTGERLAFATRLLRRISIDTSHRVLNLVDAGKAMNKAFSISGDELKNERLYSKACMFGPRPKAKLPNYQRKGLRRPIDAPVDLFVSHAWAASPELRKRQLEEMLTRMFGPSGFRRARLWFDKFSSPQEGLAFAQARRFGFFFQEYLALCPRAAVLLSPEYLFRLWCRYELVCFAALHPLNDLYLGFGCFVSGAGHPEEGQVSWSDYAAAISQASTATARCGFEADRETLQELIATNFTSIEELDDLLRFTVLALLGRSMLSSLSDSASGKQHFVPLVQLARELGYSKLSKELNRINTSLDSHTSPKLRLSLVPREFDKLIHPWLLEKQDRVIHKESPLAQLRASASKLFS